MPLNDIRLMIARSECNTLKQACELTGLKYRGVRFWRSEDPERRERFERALRLVAQDAVAAALEIRRRTVGKAMAVKARLLDSDDERIRSAAASDIIEWEMGKAKQRQEIHGTIAYKGYVGINPDEWDDDEA